MAFKTKAEKLAFRIGLKKGKSEKCNKNNRVPKDFDYEIATRHALRMGHKFSLSDEEIKKDTETCYKNMKSKPEFRELLYSEYDFNRSRAKK